MTAVHQILMSNLYMTLICERVETVLYNTTYGSEHAGHIKALAFNQDVQPINTFVA